MRLFLSVCLELRLEFVILFCSFTHHFFHVLYFRLEDVVRFFYFIHVRFHTVELAVRRHQKDITSFNIGSVSVPAASFLGLQSGWCRSGSLCSILSVSCCLTLAPGSSPHNHTLAEDPRRRTRGSSKINPTMTPFSLLLAGSTRTLIVSLYFARLYMKRTQNGHKSLSSPVAENTLATPCEQKIRLC